MKPEIPGKRSYKGFNTIDGSVELGKPLTNSEYFPLGDFKVVLLI